MTDNERSTEFLSCIATLELAAMLNRQSPEGRIRATCIRIKKRLVDKKLKQVLSNIQNSPSPLTMMIQMKIVAEEAAGGQIYW